MPRHVTAPGKLSVHEQGDGGVLEHMASYAAEDHLAQPRMRVSAHHEQITVKFLGSRQEPRPNDVVDRQERRSISGEPVRGEIGLELQS
jgi:hypothetical protein